MLSDQITNVVSKLSNSKSMDFYWLSNYIVKNTVSVISKPLAFVFTQCLHEGYFSDLLKITKVTPIFKKGDKKLAKNYRPVSIVPIFSKIIETLIYQQLAAHFARHNLLSDCQFGFRTNRSTITAVMRLVEQITEAFENKKSAALTLFDLSKAFDCVPYDFLIAKFRYYGISDNSVKIIQAYLNNRSQYVAVSNRKTSDLGTVTMGVPQGSVLGPFLFIVFINDFTAGLNVNVNKIVYADDITVMGAHSNLQDLTTIMNEAYKNSLEWFTNNELVCNNDKTQKMILTLSNNGEVNSVKLLGIKIDSKLNWTSHIDFVATKISRVSYLFWKLRDLVSFKYLRMSYFGLFQSHLAYGLILWGHSTHVHKLLLIQKKVIRTICRAGPIDHCKPLFKRLQILTVINLYILHILLYTKTNYEQFITREEIHKHNTRNKHKIDIPQHRLAVTGSSFILNCVKFFNKLPQSVTNLPINQFKSKMNNWLVNNPFYSTSEFLDKDIDTFLK